MADIVWNRLGSQGGWVHSTTSMSGEGNIGAQVPKITQLPFWRIPKRRQAKEVVSPSSWPKWRARALPIFLIWAPAIGRQPTEVSTARGTKAMPAFCSPSLLPGVSVHRQKSGRARAKRPPDQYLQLGESWPQWGQGLYRAPQSNRTAFGAWEKKSSLLDGYQPGTGGCEEESVPEGIVTGYALRSYSTARWSHPTTSGSLRTAPLSPIPHFGQT